MFKRIVINKLFVSHIFLAAMFCLSCLGVQAAVSPKFTVVIDAGHGGRDPGAMGQIAQEKNINLGVALKLGQKIAANFKDVKVLYTRKTDVFLTLQERANFVNQNSADLFICIHTNAAENRDVAGAETFTLGLDKLASNLDVAMRENSVMLLEEDYKTTYQGFDPNSVESYIMFEFMQDQYIDRSLSFASSVQEQFTRQYNRKDRGVRQAAFWVLHKSACPSVLIELGFITNKAEEQFLHSAKGQQTMADAIYDAFVEEIAACAKDLQAHQGSGREDLPMGPVINKSAFDRISHYIEIARNEGTIVCGGGFDDSKGFYIEPMVVRDVAKNAVIAKEEIFGPVLAVIRAESFDEALEIANNTEYGLTGSVYTEDRAHIQKAKEEFHVGNLYFNRKSTGAVVLQHPFGGFNMSGTDAKTGTRDYLTNFLNLKSICEDLTY